MTRDEINKRLKRVSIKGREYIEVNQRILAFWELYPDGKIITEKLTDDGNRCDFKAVIFGSKDDLGPIATGHAFEFQGAGMVNKTSYVENAETSAVGRALGILGIGITDSIASADEVSQAIEHQDEERLRAAQQKLLEAERKYCKANGIDDWGEFHRESIMKRQDYSNDADTLEMISYELEQAS